MSYFRVSLTGTLPGNEVWSVNPQFMVQGEGGDLVWVQAEGQAAADAIIDLAPPSGLSVLMSPSTLLTGCRLELRGDTGTLLGAAEAAVPGGYDGDGTGVLPNQSAVVLSLRTDTPGGHGRGRLYWPATGVQVGASTGRLLPAIVSSAAAGAASYMTQIQDAINAAITIAPAATIDLAVISGTVLTQYPVVQIRVGDVVDQQRRRRDKIREVYAISGYPA